MRVQVDGMTVGKVGERTAVAVRGSVAADLVVAAAAAATAAVAVAARGRGQAGVNESLHTL